MTKSILAAIPIAVLSVAAAHALPTTSFTTDSSVTDGSRENVVPEDYFSWLEGATVTFNGASTTWAAGDGLWGSGSFCGGASIDGFSLGGCGRTGNDTDAGGSRDWYLDNTTAVLLTSFVVDLTTANVLPQSTSSNHHWFDRRRPNPGSNRSANGEDFTYRDGPSSINGAGGNIAVEYSVSEFQVPGDLWGVMSVDLTGLTSDNTTGGLGQHRLAFRQDTDAVVPLPAAGWLMITAFAGLAATRRRKSKAA